MQRINKQTTTPFGLAFIFLGLAIVPVSLKAVGVNINFSPRVNAVANAWARITGGAISAYQPLGTVELSALNIFDCCTDSSPVEPSDEPCQMACLEGQGAAFDCEQADKAMNDSAFNSSALDTSAFNSIEPKCERATSAPRLIALAKRDAIAKIESRSGRKFEFSVMDVESIDKPIVASRTELAVLVEKRMGRYRFHLKSVKGFEATRGVKVLFEAAPSNLFERDARRKVRSEKDCDSGVKPERLRTVSPTPVVVERTETRGA